jgi:hypothetical protein
MLLFPVDIFINSNIAQRVWTLKRVRKLKRVPWKLKRVHHIEKMPRHDLPSHQDTKVIAEGSKLDSFAVVPSE